MSEQANYMQTLTDADLKADPTKLQAKSSGDQYFAPANETFEPGDVQTTGLCIRFHDLEGYEWCIKLSNVIGTKASKDGLGYLLVHGGHTIGTLVRYRKLRHCIAQTEHDSYLRRLQHQFNETVKTDEWRKEQQEKTAALKEQMRGLPAKEVDETVIAYCAEKLGIYGSVNVTAFTESILKLQAASVAKEVEEQLQRRKPSIKSGDPFGSVNEAREPKEHQIMVDDHVEGSEF